MTYFSRFPPSTPKRRRTSSNGSMSDEKVALSFKDKYTSIECENSRTGFGAVYSGVRKEDQFPVTIKLIKRKNVVTWQRDDCGGGIPLEIVTLQLCQDIPSVVQLLDWYEHENVFVIVMERPNPGQDLFDYISYHGSLNECLAKNFLKQLVDAVATCTQRNVLHRNIEDQNVMVDLRNGRLKLVDFASSCLFKPDNGLSSFGSEGNISCNPPEWIMQSNHDGLKATVWSLGILLYEMVCGDKPYQYKQAIQNEQSLQWPSYVSESCRNLVERCLDCNPKTRCNLQEIVEHEWMQNDSFELPIDARLLRHGGHQPPDIDALRKPNLKHRMAVDRPTLVDPFGRTFLSNQSDQRCSPHYRFKRTTRRVTHA